MGHGRVDACKRAKISHPTFMKYFRAGEFIHESGIPPQEKEDELLLEFYQEVLEAECDFEETALGAIYDAGADDWKAHAWRLERLMPKKYARRTVQYENDDEMPDPTEAERQDTDLLNAGDEPDLKDV